MKKFIALLSAVSVLFSLSAMIATAAPSDPVNPTSSITRSEEVTWVTREYNGKKQMRLWSITYERWLTDWIDC